jgi:hypothetical protein
LQQRENNKVANVSLLDDTPYFAAVTVFAAMIFSHQAFLGSGSIVTTSAGYNFDLFVVLNSRTNNFVVVTEITYKTYQLGNISAGSIICNASTVT